LSMSDFTKGLDLLLNKLRDIFKNLKPKSKSRNFTSNNHLDDPSDDRYAYNLHTKQPEVPQVSDQQPDIQPVTQNSITQAGSKITNSNSLREWILPDPYKILKPPKPVIGDEENDQHRARVIEESLKSFGAPAHVVEIRRGPSITLFGVEPDFVEGRSGPTRVRVSRITNLADDLAMALKASRIRIQAPVPGKGYVGIEVPNREIAVVSLLEVLTSQRFKEINSPLKFALGKDVTGNAAVADLTAMPHLLIAGTTNSGKSVCINAILACYLLTNTPDQLRLILVDPKRVELTGYNGIPHLLAPVIVDADRVVGALQWMQREMDSRYHKFSECGTRNIQEFNAWRIERKESPIPNLLVVIDELADLMMLAPDETERALTRLAQLARATGIHLILATQRPSTDILTGLIKANFPARIAFAVAQGVDSRVILDQPGAERLLGKGDMLFQAPDAPAPVRLQGTYVSDDELSHLVSFWRQQTVSEDAPTRPSQPAAFTMPQNVPFKQDTIWEEMEKDPDEDPMTKEVIAIIRQEGRASISMLQRKFRIGYTRAARLIESIQEKGIIGPPDSQTQVREVLDYGTIGPPVED
ncbi:MAG: DNA translocase FtsK, partial [Anaerolineaceae bacterium]|nr:DNA translocase FtsK [Anaerolineaceae bacterium]